MPPRHPRQRRRTGRRREAIAARRARRIAALVALAAVALVVLLLTAFGSGSPSAVPTLPAPASRLLPAGPPRPQVVALAGSLRIGMPIAQSRVTAIAFHAAGPGALPLRPLGRQANQGAASRFFHRLFGGGGSGLRYYLVSGGTGVQTGELDVGGATGTDVYAPVDGTVVGIAPNVLDGKRYGVRLDLQPSGSPSVVLSLTHLRIDPSLAVGDTVIASSSKLGRVLDFSGVEQQSLARYTPDAGNHVAIQVHPAASLSVP
jgi:murein DD-endopeptidase MepM/ murein hydrolase activator NlpD